ncbi:MAG: ribosome-associated translation inhibitor RaiA [Deltaproteobacteria bacterium]|nr:MAG: ribosome-associated translation inhibitor RaiA [Deltaproteobacteria bacterium]
MKISVTSRHLKSNKGLRDYVEEKLLKMGKYLSEPIEANVVLTGEKFRQLSEVAITHSGLTTRGEGEAADIRSAIDNAIEKLEKQLRRQKDKFNHQKKVMEKWKS